MVLSQDTLYKPGILAALLLFIIGCRFPAASVASEPIPPEAHGTLTFHTLKIDGSERRYALYLPPDLGTEPRPLIMELHGGGITIEDVTGLSGHTSPYKLWMNLADAEHFIVVYPQGLNGAYGKPTWNDCRGDASVNSQADDVAFLNTLINRLEATYPIDSRRIYISGTSNGGLMALRLAEEIPQQLAAVAVVAAAMPADSSCPPSTTPLSVMFINGTQDNHLPYQGGIISSPPNPTHGTVLSTKDTIHIWIERNGTNTTPLVTHYPDLDPHDHSTVTRFTYSRGKDNTEVILYEVAGGGHAAPSIRETYSWLFEHYFGYQNHDIETVWEEWQFFRQHHR